MSDTSFFTSRLDEALGWARKYSIFQYPFVTACCGMEYMATACSHYDVDRFGAGRMMAATAALCFTGATVTAAGAGFPGMAAGRLLFGIGAETFNVATLAAIVLFFSGRHLAFAIGVSFAASLAYLAIERRRALPANAGAAGAARLDWRQAVRFHSAFWLLFALCVLWYAVIFAFRSTFSIKYFQHAHGLDLAAAGTINGVVYLAALFATPFFGWVADRAGRPAPLLAFGALLLPAAIASMTVVTLPLWLGTALIGVSYSLVPAVLWPLASQLVPARRLGSALALLSVGLNLGIAGANLAVGRLNDHFAAGAGNPAGYKAMMVFFFVCGSLGFAAALLLSRRGQTP